MQYNASLLLIFYAKTVKDINYCYNYVTVYQANEFKFVYRL